MLKKFLVILLLKQTAMLFLVCFVLLIARVEAQVAIDSRSAGGAFSNTGVTTLSWTHAAAGNFQRDPNCFGYG
jgi:hypothetical protein